MDDHCLSRFAQIIPPGGQLIDHWPLTGGLSAAMTAFVRQRRDGARETFVIRVPRQQALSRNPQLASEQFHILQLVSEFNVRMPTPIFLDNDGQHCGTPCYVMTYIMGTPDYNPHDRHHMARQAARQMAQLHQTQLTDTARSFLPTLWTRCEQWLKPDNPLAQPNENAIANLLQSQWPLPKRNRDVLMHGDFWPGNWLWHKGELVAVVDWEDAALGDPIADLAITRLDMCLIFGLDIMRTFTNTYQSHTTFEFSDLRRWDLVAALRAADHLEEWAAGWPQLGRPDITTLTFRRAFDRFVQLALDSL